MKFEDALKAMREGKKVVLYDNNYYIEIASIFFAILVAIIPSSRRAAYIFNLSTAVRHEDTILQKLGQQYIKEIQFIGDNR